MRKIIHLTVLILTILGTLSAGQTAWAAPLRGPAVLSLVDLGAANEIVLHGPYDTTHIQFSLPPAWTLQDGAELDLVISAYFASSDTSVPAPTTGNNFLGALLDVSFNGTLQKSVALNAGDHLVYRVPIQVTSLKSVSRDGTLDIGFFLNAAIDCNYAYHHTTVVIDGTSQALFPYAQVPLRYDLRRLPWPLYQTGLRTPEPALVVVPDNASAGELQAGLVAMAALGRMSHSKLPATLVTAGQLTDNTRNQSNLVFVGKAASLSSLGNITLPVAMSGSQFAAAEMKADDGVVEIATSPWNPEKSVLIVGGNSDAGTAKAAQALSTGLMQTGTTPAYSIVAEVNPEAALSAESGVIQSPDMTLADMGNAASTITGMGTNWFSYTFIVPPGQVATGDPYLSLVYSNSALLDPGRSGAVVYLNGDTVGSVAFSATNPNNVKAQVNLPLSSIHPGRNVLDIAATLIPYQICSAFSFNGLWMTVYPETILHLPLAAATPQALALQDLASYPFPFANDPSMSTTTFVVPQGDPSAWANAGALAYDMGARSTGAIVALDAAYDGQLSQAQQRRDLILVGQPKDLTLIASWKDSMPAYFDKGSNAATLPAEQVTYRIAPNKDLGYLELFASPLDSSRAVLAVLGTSANGIASSATAMVDTATRQNLKGNFATVDGQQTTVVDTRSGVGSGQLPSALGPAVTTDLTPVAVSTGAPVPAPAPYNRQPILILLGAVVLLIVVVLVLALVMQGRKVKGAH